MDEEFKSHDNPEYLMIGLFWSFMFSIPLWILIYWLVSLLFFSGG